MDKNNRLVEIPKELWPDFDAKAAYQNRSFQEVVLNFIQYNMNEEKRKPFEDFMGY